MSKVKSSTRYKSAMELLAAMESVAVAEDKEVTTSTPDVPAGKDDVAPITPSEGVTTEVKDTPEKVIPVPNLTGQAVVQDVVKVTTHIDTDLQNAAVVDTVNIGTADGVKAGEKDLTTGVVSKEDSIEGNEAEHIPDIIADDAVMNIEEAVTQLDESVPTASIDNALDKADEVGEELEEFEKVEVALESYVKLLSDLRAKGEQPTRATAAAIRIGLQSHSRSYFAHTVPSLEAFGRPDEMARHNATVSLEAALSQKLGEMKDAGVAALKRLLELMIEVWESVSRDVPGLVSKIKALIEVIKSQGLKGGEKISTKGAERLSVSGEFVGDSDRFVGILATQAEEVLVKWPTALLALAKQLDKPEAVGKLESLSHAALERALPSFVKVSADVAPSDLAEFHIVTRSQLMPGNRVMFLGESGDNSAGEAVTGADKLFRFKLDTMDAGTLAEEVSVPTDEAAVATLTALYKITDILQNKDSATRDLKELSKSLQSDKNTPEGKAVRGIISAGLSQHRQFIGYLVGTVKAYTAFYNHLTTAEMVVAE